MKIRNGFVSNSSTSSFICDVCNNIESGMDLNISDAGMFECENEHTFCENHFIGNIDDIDYKKFILNEINKEIVNTKKMMNSKYCSDIVWYKTHLKDLKNKLKDYNENSDDYDFYDLAENEYELRYNIPAEYCPICSLNKINDYELLQFIMKVNNFNKEQIIKEIKNRFKNYNELEEFIKK